MKMQEKVYRCRLACGQEAVAMDLPERLGFAMHDGQLSDDLEDWNEDVFHHWFLWIEKRYPVASNDDLLELYERVSKVIKSYGLKTLS